MAQLFKNNAFSTLGATLSNVATSMTVATGHGDRFPAVTAPDFALLTLQDASNNIEIIKVTARTSGADSMTIQRAQEGTTARSWAIGDVVELRVTASALNPLGVFEGAATAAAIRSAIGAVAKSGDTMTGPLDFSGAALRIRGDFSNATVASRLMFQTSVPNSATSVSVIPSGTSLVSSVNAYNASDPTNAAIMQAQAWSTDIRFASSVSGSGTPLPMTFYAGGSERLRIDTSGNVIVTGSGGLGYGTGSGGTVTQATSKSTAVTLNKPSGQITMNNATLNSGDSVTFDLNNTLINPGGEARDVLIVVPYNSSNYRVEVASMFGSAARIRVTNVTGSNLSEALVISFAIIKGERA